VARLPLSAIFWWIAVLSLLIISVLAGYVEISLATIGLVFLCAGCELMDSSLGMGYGTTLTPILIVAGVEPLLLVPTILVSELVSGFGAAFFHAEVGNISLRRGSTHLRVAVILSLCSLLGVYAGVELALNIPGRLLVAIISLVILTAGIYVLVHSARQSVYRTWKIAILGVVASFNKALSGGGYGPLMTSGQILSGVAGRSAVGITSLAEAFTCLAAAALFLLKGRELELGLLIPVLSGALLSVPLSAQLVRRFSESALKRIIAVATIGLGLLSLLKAIAG
jgi:uncharacterized membrane protein YfcA